MKLFKKCFLLLICLMGLAVVAACDNSDVIFHTVEFESNGGSAVEKITVKHAQTVEKPADPTLKWHDFVGWFTDEELTKEYNFDAIVEDDLKLYAKWEEQEIENEIEVLAVEESKNMTNYKANKGEKENKRTEFMDREQPYVVGDDNAWSVKPEVTFISVNPVTEDWDITEVDVWEYVINVYILVDTQYVEADAKYIDSIDAEKATVNFSEEAINNQFKVEVYPNGLTEDQMLEVENYTIATEIKVVDGYNAYTALDLAYIDNRDASDDEGANWIKFKQEKGLDVTLAPSRIILHNNIEVTVNDLPKEFFYQEGDEDLKASDSDYARTLGSLRDYANLYTHNFVGNEEFTLSGNYFQLSMANLPVVTRENEEITEEGSVISHSVFLKFIGSVDGFANVENISLLGNAPRVQNNIKGGGLILIQDEEGPSFKAYNNIATANFIAYMSDLSLKPFIIEKCKAYDSFNSFIYNWGCDKMELIDCEMKDAGGPVIIQDHVKHEADGTGGYKSYTKVVNCDLESYVNGSEGWFTLVQASPLISPIVGLDLLFNAAGKSILSTNTTNNAQYFNVICVNKSGSSQSPTNTPVQGTFEIADYAFDYGASSVKTATIKTIADMLSAPYFESSAGGAAWTDGQTGLFTEVLVNGQIPTPIEPTDAILQGDYISIYYYGMMIIFEYGAVGDTHTPVN